MLVRSGLWQTRLDHFDMNPWEYKEVMIEGEKQDYITKKAQEIADLAIEIDCKGTGLLEIDNVDKVLKSGYDSIMAHKEEIYSLLK